MARTKKLTNKKELEKIIDSLNPERKEVSGRLKEHKWFTNSSIEIQTKILLAPPDFDAAINDLSNRSDEIGNLHIVKITDFLLGNYHAIIVFQVRSLVNNQEYKWDFVVSKFGKNPGFKGLIFIEAGGEIKYFLIKREVRFPLGYETYSSIGGYIQFQNNKLVNLPKNVEDQIKRQLGIKEIIVNRFIDLGQIYSDTQMTNAHISLFAAIVRVENEKKLKNIIDKRYFSKKITFDLEIVPVNRLREYIHKIDEPYFHTCITRLISMGILKLSD